MLGSLRTSPFSLGGLMVWFLPFCIGGGDPLPGVAFPESWPSCYNWGVWSFGLAFLPIVLW